MEPREHERVLDGLWRTRKLRDTTGTLKAPQKANRLARKGRLTARPTGTQSDTKSTRGTRKAGGMWRSWGNLEARRELLVSSFKQPLTTTKLCSLTLVSLNHSSQPQARAVQRSKPELLIDL